MEADDYDPDWDEPITLDDAIAELHGLRAEIDRLRSSVAAANKADRGGWIAASFMFLVWVLSRF